jgi:cell division transport system ATP-binding protein
MIEFQHVSKHYGNLDALRDVSFRIDGGEMTFLTGHSGAGKSTLLKLIMLMERASQGHVLVDGQKLAELKRSHVPYLRRKIGFVYQNHHLLFDRNVFNNVALPLQVLGHSPRDIARRVRPALDKVGLLSKEYKHPHELSTGEQQRVGIARAVVNKPSILLADEPTGNLDPELSAEIMNLFENFKRVGVAVLVATHDLALIAKMPHRSLILRHGSLVSSGISSESAESLDG